MSNKNVVHSQGREIIYNVFQFIKEQKESLKLTTLLYETVATATGVGISTVKRICKEAKRNRKVVNSNPAKEYQEKQLKSTVGYRLFIMLYKLSIDFLELAGINCSLMLIIEVDCIYFILDTLKSKKLLYL
ncbi:hypothetical protein FQA39_LY18556 [Lamprigera yunnana]|nr:hypothetical protein FQA39_LY18556 [Lamprigera yunnana]